MKKPFTILFLLLVNLAHGQNYRLFNSANKKLFASIPSQSETFSIAFDSVTASGSDSVYYNFFGIRETAIPTNCIFWCSSDCQTQDVPTWAGGKIIDNNSGLIQFFTLSGDTLNFNFNLSIGDSSLFYQDVSQKFFFRFDEIDTMTVLSAIDSVKEYTIVHTDAAGNVINSQLNNEKIIVAKNRGLAQFFQVDSFPSVLKAVALAGSVSPDGGFYKLTNEELYDFQPGDEIQTHLWRNQFGFPPPYSYNRYQLITVLNRTDGPDTIYYEFSRVAYDSITFITTMDTIFPRYYRHSLIAQIPFEFYDGNNRELYMDDYCGINLWTYTVTPIPSLGYCADENCWGCIDTQGPPPAESTTYVAGLGIYDDSGFLGVPPPYGYSRRNNIVYFKKNGIPCGSIITGMPGISKDNDNIVVTPNPVSTVLNIRTAKTMKEIGVMDVHGKNIFSQHSNSNQSIIGTDNLNEGMYFLRIIFSDGSLGVRKIVVAKE
jgi:hypothetical protein